MIILHTMPIIRANIASSWSAYTKVSALNWYSYYFGFVYCINIISRTIQGDFFIVLHFVKRFVWESSVLPQWIYYCDFYFLCPSSRLRDRAIIGYGSPTWSIVNCNTVKYYYNFLIKITASSYYLLFCFNAWYSYTTKYWNTLHSLYFIVLGARL